MVKGILALIEPYFNFRFVLVPISSALRQKPITPTSVKVYRDWSIFGLRVVRFQLNLIGK